MGHDEIIRSLGGYKEVAEDLQLNPTTVFKWLKAGIPARRWIAIRDLAASHKMDVSLEYIAKTRPQAAQAAEAINSVDDVEKK